MNIKINSRIYNKYKINKIIGNGGFSEVYKIENKFSFDSDDKFYALKYLVLKNENNKNGVINRFLQEIKIMKQVNSKFFPKYIDSYLDDEEQYLVMEYIEGRNISELLKRNGKFSTEAAVSYVSQACEAIHELHTLNIIHRDIKSSNILINKLNEIRILDFGLSLDPDSQRHTEETKVVGSVCYMAPELCTTNTSPSRKSDIYALGILLFELLTGIYPIQGKDAQETLKKQSSQLMPRVTDYTLVPTALENVIIKATAKDPEKRYKSAYEMKRDLDTSLDKSRIFEKPLNTKTYKSKKYLSEIINSKAFLITMVIISIILLIIGITLITVFSSGGN
ncbi:serine/threonine protein kinase [Mycoplasmopsis maculosa]|uniref:Serine/threonine protein kinase n=1 Tax=Mycoplasmopsis maculosa TaxID=114885 RepID=A0A449B4H5_9BACT|nr:serine/threonine-protein kinase [Mycoplasmopsis maculosa]VEU75490.1 serine/threonine protein kinase [Mycoplasmopsis maculosa]